MASKYASPEAEAELAPIRRAVEALRAFLENYRGSTAIEPTHSAVVEAATGLDEVMRELTPLGFHGVGYVGDTLKDGTLVVSRVFSHADGRACGWLGFLPRREGPRLLVFMVSEGAGSTYCTSLRGGSPLTLVRPPHQDHADYPVKVTLARMAEMHLDRSRKLRGAQAVAAVKTVDDYMALMERMHQARMAWRASCDADELMRADLRSVLATSSKDLTSSDFWLVYTHAAEWLDFTPPRRTHLGSARKSTKRRPRKGAAPKTLSTVLATPPSGDAPTTGTAGVESEWIEHGPLQVKGARLQIVDVYQAGNDPEGVILPVTAGEFVVEARVVTFGDDQRVSRVRVRPTQSSCVVGDKAGEVGVDLAAIAVTDVDLLGAWAEANRDETQDWGQELWFNRAAPAGFFSCPAASTELAFVDSGIGDGTYPVYYLVENGRNVGLEVAFIPPGTAWPFDGNQ